MTQICTYCDEKHDISETVFAIIFHGFGHANKEHKPFCSVECRVWWRRRESDNPGEWEQPAPKGYQGRLDRFAETDFPDECTLGKIERGPDTETGTDRPASEAATGQEATA